MNNTDYTYAVARIRANEINNISTSDYEQLINSSDREAVIRILNDKGWMLDSNNISATLENEYKRVWKLICESVPDPDVIDSLIIGNDFFNLKAAIKANFSNLNPENYYTAPCTVDTALISDAVTHNNFSQLPEILKKAGQKAYDVYVEGFSGQDAEIIIDKACLETSLFYASKAGSALLKQIYLLKCFCANVKVAIRCTRCNKSHDFALDAMCNCPKINNELLLDSAQSSKSLAEYISETEFSFLSESISNGFTEFENECEKYILKLCYDTKYEIYSPDPIIAYWFVRLNEISNARIIISAKSNSLSSEEIREKVRVVDV